MHVEVVRTPADADLAHRLLAHLDPRAVLDAVQPDAVAVERVFSQQNVRTVMGTAQAGRSMRHATPCRAAHPERGQGRGHGQRPSRQGPGRRHGGPPPRPHRGAQRPTPPTLSPSRSATCGAAILARPRLPQRHPADASRAAPPPPVSCRAPRRRRGCAVIAYVRGSVASVGADARRRRGSRSRSAQRAPATWRRAPGDPRGHARGPRGLPDPLPVRRRGSSARSSRSCRPSRASGRVAQSALAARPTRCAERVATEDRRR